MMDALAGYGSESSSSANEENTPQREESTRLLGSALSETANDEDVALISPRKRQKLLDHGGVELLQHMLPLPPTRVACENSLVLLDEDYLSPMLTLLNGVHLTAAANNPNCRVVKARIVKSTSDSVSDQSLEENLRSGKEYYNPLLLEIARDRFKIMKPLQTRARHTSSVPKPYEKQIFQKGTSDA